MRSPDLINSGLLILRILLGALLAAHGGLKFLQPGGLNFEADLLVKDGLGGGRPAAAVSGLTQVMTDGAEFPLIFAGLAIVVGLVGPGGWSLDHALRIFPSTRETLGAVGLGLAAGLATFPVLKQMKPRTTGADAAPPAPAATPSPLNQEQSR